MTNSLGSYVHEQMGLLGWSREVLVERSGLDRFELEVLFESPVLMSWPTPETMLGLARALNVSVREIVMHAAHGCGLHVEVEADPETAMHRVANEDLMREVRRRLVLGAATGGYLATPGSYYGADTGAQFG